MNADGSVDMEMIKEMKKGMSERDRAILENNSTLAPVSDHHRGGSSEIKEVLDISKLLDSDP
jgi:hypothetical protein